MKTVPANNQSARKLCLAAILALALPACSGESGEAETTVAGPEAAANDMTTMAEVRDEAKDLRETLLGYGADQKAEAQAEIDAALKRVDKRFTTIETRVEERWDDLSEAAQAKAETQLRMLREKKTELADSYSDVTSETDAAWEQLQHGFADAYAEINAAFSQAEREIGLDS